MVIEIPPNPGFKGGPFPKGVGKRDGERDLLDDEFDGTSVTQQVVIPVEDLYDADAELP